MNTRTVDYNRILSTATFCVLICCALSIAAPASASSQANSYLDNSDGSVTDLATGLTWQKQDDNTRRSRRNATRYCNDLSLASKSDWRLPHIKELITIVDHRVNKPAINSAAFPDTDVFLFWSATTLAGFPDDGWAVDFDSGSVTTRDEARVISVRCVR